MAQLLKRRKLRRPELPQAVAWTRQEADRRSLEKLRGRHRGLVAVQMAAVVVSTIVAIVRPKSLFLSLLGALVWLFTPARWAIRVVVNNPFIHDEPFETYNSFSSSLYLRFVVRPSFDMLIAFAMLVSVLNLSAVLFLLPSLVTICLRSYRLRKALRFVWRKIFTLRDLQFFSFLLLGGSMLYYLKFYNSAGTSKRAWSDALG